ncbi:RING/U-box superfamily protein [Striga asiatica]|uniref:RING-type E3 ubiquitin transferase n=1 Tax=Striga asiatica TaxID=4170 RepID=A0A5A7Q2Q1_STRAF|nr:RING/U-box superfamily protein [Striga asiatica]
MKIGSNPYPPNLNKPTGKKFRHHHLRHVGLPIPATFTPSDDNFLLTSPYLRRLIHHLTTVAAEADPRSDPAPRSSIDSLQEVAITPDSDLTALCPVCKDPFAVGTLAKMMPCKHAYHPDCIVPWLEINNSCPVCRFKLPAVEDGKNKEGGQEAEPAGLEELVDDEADLFVFQNTLRHMARRNRWNENLADVGGGSEGNLLSPTQIGEVERDGLLERQSSVETVSSWPRWHTEERGGGGAGGEEDGGAFGRSS